MSLSLAERCSKSLMQGFSSHLCARRATHVHDGKPYCGTHYPPNVEARKKKQQARWDAEAREARRKHALKKAYEAIAEAALKCYDANGFTGVGDLDRACAAYRELEKP